MVLTHVNPEYYNFNNFNAENSMPSNATNQPKSTVKLGYMCPRGLSGPPAVTFLE